jgi:D-alanyl-D-alanine carboxypeptidase
MEKIIIIFAALAALFFGSCKKYPNTIPNNKIVESSLATDYINRLNVVFDSTCNANGIKGASASIAIANKGLWKRSYGVSHGNVAINTNMLLPIGSNTKTMTAVCILKLQEQGKLTLLDTIGKWFNHPNINKRITIKQLLNHTSGMAYYDSSTAFQNAIYANTNKVWTDAEFYQFLRPAHFAPGTSWDYSNTNYCLLGFIISKVTGKATKDVFNEFIFQPAGLANTFYFPFQPIVGVVPHLWSESVSGSFEDITTAYNYSLNAFHSLGGGADGCVLSTAFDNNKFWFALFNNKLININSMEQMQQFIPITNTEAYGLGLIRRRGFSNREILFHDGSVIGGVNSNYYDAVNKAHITVLANQDNVDLSIVTGALHKVTVQFEK